MLKLLNHFPYGHGYGFQHLTTDQMVLGFEKVAENPTFLCLEPLLTLVHLAASTKRGLGIWAPIHTKSWAFSLASYLCFLSLPPDFLSVTLSSDSSHGVSLSVLVLPHSLSLAVWLNHFWPSGSLPARKRECRRADSLPKT